MVNFMVVHALFRMSDELFADLVAKGREQELAEALGNMDFGKLAQENLPKHLRKYLDMKETGKAIINNKERTVTTSGDVSPMQEILDDITEGPLDGGDYSNG